MTIGRIRAFSEPKARIVIDSMVVDHIADAPGLVERIQRAIANGVLTIVETHILRDQLSKTPDETRRALLLRVYDALPKVAAPTSGFVLDVSRLGGAELGDESLEGLATRGRGRMQDALLASTASGKADVLVTEDHDLLETVKMKKLRCEVWTFVEFRRFVEEHT